MLPRYQASSIEMSGLGLDASTMIFFEVYIRIAVSLVSFDCLSVARLCFLGCFVSW